MLLLFQTHEFHDGGVEQVGLHVRELFADDAGGLLLGGLVGLLELVGQAAHHVGLLRDVEGGVVLAAELHVAVAVALVCLHESEHVVVVAVVVQPQSLQVGLVGSKALM